MKINYRFHTYFKNHGTNQKNFRFPHVQPVQQRNPNRRMEATHAETCWKATLQVRKVRKELHDLHTSTFTHAGPSGGLQEAQERTEPQTYIAVWPGAEEEEADQAVNK